MTRQEAINAKYKDVWHHVTAKNADCTPLRARVNGVCKVWKTRPSDFRLPMKFGFFGSGCFYITPHNANDWRPGDGHDKQ